MLKLLMLFKRNKINDFWQNKRRKEIFMETAQKIFLVVTIIGAVNWGLIGFFHFDLVAALFGSMSTLSKLIYIIVGIGGIYAISFFAKSQYAND